MSLRHVDINISINVPQTNYVQSVSLTVKHNHHNRDGTFIVLFVLAVVVFFTIKDNI